MVHVRRILKLVVTLTFVCEHFVVLLRTTKTTKFLFLEKYPLRGIWYLRTPTVSCVDTVSRNMEYTPRMWQLTSATGEFTANEVLCPSRSQEVEAFPFLQTDLYTVEQPGKKFTSVIWLFMCSVRETFVYIQWFVCVFGEVDVCIIGWLCVRIYDERCTIGYACVCGE